jgi:hypothetical protein
MPSAGVLITLAAVDSSMAVDYWIRLGKQDELPDQEKIIDFWLMMSWLLMSWET